MKIIHIHAIYKSSPISLVVEIDTGAILELSMKELQEADSIFEERAWQQLTEDCKMFFPNQHERLS
jgi:hypothetical protein